MKTETDINWENRTLCSDGNCIGVIGPDGRCKECQKPYEGESEGEDLRTPDEPDATDEPYAEESVSMDEDAATSSDIDWESRRLCSDEGCIGVIGPDGRCKECGKADENSA